MTASGVEVTVVEWHVGSPHGFNLSEVLAGTHCIVRYHGATSALESGAEQQFTRCFIYVQFIKCTILAFVFDKIDAVIRADESRISHSPPT